MHPVFLSIGSFSIRYYGVFAALGFLAALTILTALRRFVPMSKDEAGNLTFTGMICGVLGARIYYVCQFHEQFAGRWIDVIRIDKGGLVFFGGFFLAMIGIFVYCRKRRLDVLKVLDVTAIALCAAHAFGRVGCFLNGCCFGKVTQCWTGVAYPPGSAPYLRYGAAPLHPVQLYEAAFNVLLGLLLLRVLRLRRRGLVTSCYVAGYGVLRFCDEFFRGDAPRIYQGFLSPAQWIGVALIAAGLASGLFFLSRSSDHGGSSAEL